MSACVLFFLGATAFEETFDGNVEQAESLVESAEEEEEGPDLLLRESARIVSDVAELESNLDLLNRKFTQLNADKPEANQLN